MFQQLLGRAPITASDDQCGDRARMGAGGDMHQIFVVEKFILLRHVERAIQHQKTAKAVAFMDFDALVGTAEFTQHPACADGVAKAVVQRLGQPASAVRCHGLKHPDGLGGLATDFHAQV